MIPKTNHAGLLGIIARVITYCLSSKVKAVFGHVEGTTSKLYNMLLQVVVLAPTPKFSSNKLLK
jgi:hypothetical protein